MSKIIKSMHKIIKSMHEDLKSMRKIIKSMRKIIKSMCKIIKSMRKDLKSMRKVNARKFKINVQGHCSKFKLQLHNAIYRLRFYSNSLIHILLLSNFHNDVASLQKNRDDKSHRVIVP